MATVTCLGSVVVGKRLGRGNASARAGRQIVFDLFDLFDSHDQK